jgi:hypothetical protein
MRKLPPIRKYVLVENSDPKRKRVQAVPLLSPCRKATIARGTHRRQHQPSSPEPIEVQLDKAEEIPPNKKSKMWLKIQKLQLT